jgi:hypothetical protein
VSLTGAASRIHHDFTDSLTGISLKPVVEVKVENRNKDSAHFLLLSTVTDCLILQACATLAKDFRYLPCLICAGPEMNWNSTSGKIEGSVY